MNRASSATDLPGEGGGERESVRAREREGRRERARERERGRKKNGERARLLLAVGEREEGGKKKRKNMSTVNRPRGRVSE